MFILLVMFCLTAYWILFFVVPSAQPQAKVKRHPEYVAYEGAQLWRTALRSVEDNLLIKQLKDDNDVDIWKWTPNEADFLVEAVNKMHLYRQLESKKLNYTVLIKNVQRRIDSQAMIPNGWNENALRQGHRMDWNKYPKVEVLNEYLEYLAKTYPSICKQETIGHTVQNDTIKMIKISNGNSSNKGILLMAGWHAREWIAITSVLVILREIATKYSKQPAYIKDKNWYIIPLLNPDGYRYSYTSNRLWRKNRRPGNAGGWGKKCFGVDLNRNFEKDWFITEFSETKECSSTYIGTKPFSEPEAVALRVLFNVDTPAHQPPQTDTVLKLGKRLSAMIDFHSMGQLILYPWSSQASPSKHVDTLTETSQGMAKAILHYRNQTYKTGQIYNIMYPSTGAALDWIHDSGVKHCYAIEGPDLGRYGFLMPPRYIEQSGFDMYSAVKHLGSVMSNHKKKRLRKF